MKNRWGLEIRWTPTLEQSSKAFLFSFLLPLFQRSQREIDRERERERESYCSVFRFPLILFYFYVSILVEASSDSTFWLELFQIWRELCWSLVFLRIGSWVFGGLREVNGDAGGGVDRYQIQALRWLRHRTLSLFSRVYCWFFEAKGRLWLAQRFVIVSIFLTKKNSKFVWTLPEFCYLSV